MIWRPNPHLGCLLAPFSPFAATATTAPPESHGAEVRGPSQHPRRQRGRRLAVSCNYPSGRRPLLTRRRLHGPHSPDGWVSASNSPRPSFLSPSQAACGKKIDTGFITTPLRSLGSPPLLKDHIPINTSFYSVFGLQSPNPRPPTLRACASSIISATFKKARRLPGSPYRNVPRDWTTSCGGSDCPPRSRPCMATPSFASQTDPPAHYLGTQFDRLKNHIR